MEEPVAKKAKIANNENVNLVEAKNVLEKVQKDNQSIPNEACTPSGNSDEDEKPVVTGSTDVPVSNNCFIKNPDIPMCTCEAEVKVGMLRFLNCRRFSGIIKQRYSDFMVRECDKDGKLVYLDNIDHIDVEENNTSEIKEKQEDIPACPITDVEQLTKIEEFASSEDKNSKMTLTIDDDKEHRKLVHMYIKSKYKNIETDTVTVENNSRAIQLSFKSSRQGKIKRSDKPKKSIPKYCHFVLFKQNKDTMECINLLAKMLHINTGNFAYAGTKDKRATTIQNISVQNTLSKRLQQLNQKLRNIVLGNFSYADSGLTLGDLTGNEFTIIIRDVAENAGGDIDIACTSLRDKGFINYFGLQRFGTGAVPTHDVGKALLCSKFGEACNMILQPRDENEHNNSQHEVKAQKIWMETKDPEKAFAEIKQKHSIEGKLLDGLCKRGSKNYLDALKSIPRNTRLLYLHSYQSLVWNKVVSKRIEEYGLHPEVGDLVLTSEKDENGYQQVHLLTNDDVKSGNYSINDIVLPLPGYDMKYPSNKIYDYYKELLTADGIDLHDMRRPQKELSLSGKYRKIVTKPKNVAWQIIRYNDYTIPLIENDFEQLKNSTETLRATSGEADGKHTALLLQMTLPSSCYATTALRELLITDSSYKAQMELNKNFSTK